MHKFNSRNYQYGLSLLELIVALALGLIVIFSAVQSLTAMSNSSRAQLQHAKLTETADTAFSYISFRMRNALSSPCERYPRLNGKGKLTINSLSGTVDGETITSAQETTIQNLINNLGILVNSTNVTRDFGSGTRNYATDNITILSTGDRLSPNQDVTFATSEVTINGTFIAPRTSNETLYTITDCDRMDIFRAARVETPASNPTSTTLRFSANSPQSAYRTADLSIISPLDISEISLTNDGDLLDTTIFKNSGGGLTDDIDLIRVLFGADVTGDGITDRYITSSQLGNLPNNTVLMSADIYMLVRSSAPLLSYTNNYTVSLPNTSNAIAGALPTMEQIIITDKVPRRVFMRSIVFRNSAITL